MNLAPLLMEPAASAPSSENLPAPKHYILATAGHVDHGKSSLVKALTGTDPDRLPEEKARGITIDLGFAHLGLRAEIGGEPRELQVGIVDVPGHEDFVKNMVSGVGSVDLALLVVAADDGWMPQTEEHIQILAYLGVKRAVVALTKIDLAQNEASSVEAVRARLTGSPFSQARIIPTSTITGRGLEELKQALVEELAAISPPPDIDKPRLWVDRVFTLRGVGTVVTGTLTGGQLRRGQEVMIQPSGRAARIRSIQSHNRQVEASGPGTRTALNLPDVDASADIKRGDVITRRELGSATHTWDVLLEKSGRGENMKGTPGRPLKNGTLARLHVGSSNARVRIELLDARMLAPGEKALAQIRFEKPIFAFAGDRFIIRDWAEQATLAGGVILQVGAARRHARSAENLAFLNGRAHAMEQLAPVLQSALTREGIVLKRDLLLQTRFSQAAIEQELNRLGADNCVVIIGDLVAEAGRWADLRQQATRAVDEAHRSYPERPGLALSELRALLQGEIARPEIFEALVLDLCQKDFVQEGVAIRRRSHQLKLPPELAVAGNRIRRLLASNPLDPPSRKDLAPDNASQQALRFLLQTGEAVLLKDEIVLLSGTVASATAIVARVLRQKGSATAGEIRETLGISRRVVIPLLEHLDKKGVTRREGDKRVLKGG